MAIRNARKVAILRFMYLMSNRLAVGAVGILAVWCVVTTPVVGQNAHQQPGTTTHGQSGDIITIEFGEPAVRDGVISLNAQASFELPAMLVTALNKGVNLIFVGEAVVLQEREMWPDKEIVNIRLPRRLRFHALTRKYIVDDLATSAQEAFDSLNAALRYLGRYEDIVLIKSSLAAASQATHVRMRMRLQRNNLALPLRLQTYFSAPWPMSSDWRQWAL